MVSLHTLISASPLTLLWVCLKVVNNCSKAWSSKSASCDEEPTLTGCEDLNIIVDLYEGSNSERSCTKRDFCDFISSSNEIGLGSSLAGVLVVSKTKGGP